MSTTTLATPTTQSIPAGWTRAELRTMIARYFGYQAGMATGGSTTTIVDSKLVRFANDYFNGWWALIVAADGAPPQGEEAIISDFAQTTGTLTLSGALTAAVASGDKYELYARVAPSTINDAINRVASGAEAIHALKASDSSLDYSLDGVDGLYNPRQITGVYARTQNNKQYVVYPVPYRVEDNQGRLTLRLSELQTQGDGLWLTYQMGPDGLQYDDTRVNLPALLVRARAIVYLLENMLQSQDAAGLERYGALLRDMREVMAREEAAYHHRPGRARFHTWTAGGGIPRYYKIFGDLP